MDVEAFLPQAATGFRPGRSAQTAAQAVQFQVQEAAAQHDPVLLCQLDFSKLFDTIPWDLLEHLLYELRLPPTWVRTLKQSWHRFRRFYQSVQYLSTGAGAHRGIPQEC